MLGCPPPRCYFIIFSCCWVTGKENRYSTDRESRRSLLLSFSLPSNSSRLSEMLHFRSTVVAQLFQSQLKRPLTRRVGVKAVPSASAGFSTGVADGRSPEGGRAFAGWRVPAHFTRRHGGREFCTKGDGQNDAAKDTDKWVNVFIICVKRCFTDLYNGLMNRLNNVALYAEFKTWS